jgi:tetratricopeptide (TPR) repeat protein
MYQEYLRFKKGDVIAQQTETGEWSVTKIIELDLYPNMPATAHCLCYRPVKDKPNLDSLSELKQYISAPILASSFNDSYELITNASITSEEFENFTYHLKLTDFDRYLQVTEQDVNELADRAISHYQRAYKLDEEGKQDEAIEEYSIAIDLFPYLFEAIDNRAFIYMERGDYHTALAGFEESLQIEPDGFTAFFSKGECLMRLGRLAEAESIFTEGLTKFPDRQESFRKLLEQMEGD